MRLVGQLTVAMAALLTIAEQTWAQSSLDGPSVAAKKAVASGSSRRPPARLAGTSSAAPGSVQGTWVSDAQLAAPGAMPTGPSAPSPVPDSYADAGEAPSAQPVDTSHDVGSIGSYGEESYGGEGCANGDCGGGYGGEGYGPGNGYGYLWNDVHCHHRVWARFEALSLSARGANAPVLVTSSATTDQALAGVLGEPTTDILFGGEEIDTKGRSAGRVTLGMWLIDGEFCGVEAHYLGTEEQNTNFSASGNFSDADPTNDLILARPFLNFDPAIVGGPIQDAALVSFPSPTLSPVQLPGVDLTGAAATLDGSVSVRTSSQSQSAGVLYRHLLWIDFTDDYRVDLVSGYRFFKLDEGVDINDDLTLSSPAIGQINFTSQDRFATKNQFHGGEIGLVGQVHRGRLSLEVLAKIAFGSTFEEIEINGTNTIDNGLGSVTTAGGFLAQPSNSGRFKFEDFAVLPETAVNLRYDVTSNLRASLGYNFMYLSRVARAAEQIDTRLNPEQLSGGTLTGASLPEPLFAQSGFWLQGITTGFEYRY